MDREVSDNGPVRVFVSYRRDDAGGHAGRLADDLGERLPWATVFQDVESIGPGDDFVAAVRHAIAGADAVLVVIGPGWATIAEGPAGAARLMEPGDMVRLEVSTALAQDKWVIPVLVGGAAMPDPAALPADLAPLAYRNAVEVRQEAWDGDVDRLAAALDAAHRLRPIASAPAPAPAPARRRSRGAVVATAVGVVAVVAALLIWSPWSGSEPSGDRVDASATATTAPPTGGDTGGETTDLDPPEPARTLLHGVTGERLDVEVTSASLSAGDRPTVDVTTHIRNPSDGDVFLSGSGVRLDVDGRLVAPRDFLGTVLTSRTDDDLSFTFDLTGEPTEMAFEIDFGEDTGTIPLLGEPLAGEHPAVRSDAVTVTMGTVDYRVGPPAIEVMSDRFVVSVPVGVTNRGRYGMNFWSATFRMLVDGSSQAPVTSVNDVVESNAEGSATFEWDTAPEVTTLVLRVDDGVNPAAEVPLTTG
jgi:hypothetical protein